MEKISFFKLVDRPLSNSLSKKEKKKTGLWKCSDRAHADLVTPLTVDQLEKPGGALPHMGYIGMCRCEGYGFQAVYSRIGYIYKSERLGLE